MELPLKTAHSLIRKHWTGLRKSSHYVKVALYVATPDLLDRVAVVVAESDNPGSLLRNITTSFGLETIGRTGVTRVEQRDALLPYIEHLSKTDIHFLWRMCNKNSWFEWRRRNLDGIVKATGMRFVDDTAALRELDEELHRDGPLFPLHSWGERFLETGVSNEHMLKIVGRWVSNRGQNKSLFMAANLVARFGSRRHLALLNRHKAAESQFGRAVIENARFELYLRSLE